MQGNAFQQIVLIELIGGKVAVHFLNDSLEFWEKKEETTKNEKVVEMKSNLSDFLDSNEMQQLKTIKY